MNAEQFINALSDAYDRNLQISKGKNADYAGNGDPFANFRQIESLTGGAVSVEMGIIVRMSDKMSRICNLLAKGEANAKVKDESINDTLADLANYAMILRIYREEKTHLALQNSLINH